MKVISPQYQSPTVHYDPLAQVTIVQRINSETGEVTSQTPSEKTVSQERIEALRATASVVLEPARVDAAKADAQAKADAPAKVGTATTGSSISLVA